MSYKRKYNKLRSYSNKKNYNQESFENFWTKEPHRYTTKQREIVEKRLTTSYQKLYKQCYDQCTRTLGFDINTDFYMPVPYNVKNLPGWSQALTQNVVIPFDNNLLNKIIYAEKYFLCKHNFFQNKKEKVYYSTIHYYCCFVDNKPVLFTMTTRVESLDDSNEHSLNSISMHILLKGNVPFLVSRFDTKPSCHHPNKLLNGKIPYEKVHIKGPHEHRFDQKLAVVFPFERFIGHYDAYSCPTFTKFSQAVNFMKEKFNVKDKVFDNSNNLFLNLSKNVLQNTVKNDKIKTME